MRPADRAEQHRVGIDRVGQSLVAQGRAVGVVSGAAYQTFLQLEIDGPVFGHPIDYAKHLAHHFGANAIAWKNQEFFIRCHKCRPIRYALGVPRRAGEPAPLHPGFIRAKLRFIVGDFILALHG